MKHFLRLTDIDFSTLKEIFACADTIHAQGAVLAGKSVVLFFPATSIRTRVTFEKGIALLGGQPILFPSDTLDKKEKIRDVVGYLNNWADVLIVRHNSLALLDKIASYSTVPVINAMTDENHPCEILSNLYALSKLRANYTKLCYTFVGANHNIGKAWHEAARAFGLNFRQCCPVGKGYEIAGAEVFHDLDAAMHGSDIVLTDSLPASMLPDFLPYQITLDAMKKANKNALLNPCPPFFRGEEVSADAIESPYFVGYAFKKSLLAVQQAIIAYVLSPA